MEPPPPPSSTAQPTDSSPSPSQPPPSATVPLPSSNPNPNPNPQQPSFPNPQNWAQFNRPWSQSPHISHFSSQFQSGPSPSSSSSVPVAIGVPAHRAGPPSLQSGGFPPSFNAQYGGVSPSSVNLGESGSSRSGSGPARPSMHGMQTMGVVGSQMRPTAVPGQHPQRPVQSASRPQLPSNNVPPASQNFQGHSPLRAASPASMPSPSTSYSQTTQNQPWLSGPHVRPPLPSPSFRSQINSQSILQRSHIPTPSHPLTASQQQLSSSPQLQQPSPPSSLPPENYGHQFSTTRGPQASLSQQPATKIVASASIGQAGPSDKMTSVENEEPCNRILSKRNIQELVNQIDPSEKLDTQMEDILVEIAEDFVESITTFGCSLAKHRKSDTLEAKDILLHLERNWNITLPGFSSDEIRTFRKPVTSDIHKERIAAIRRSMTGPDTVNTKSASGQAVGNVRGHLVKAPPNIVGS